MSAGADIVLGREPAPAEDDLRLPRPPGVFRLFWARHPWWTDAIVATIALLLTALAVVVTATEPVLASAAQGSFVAAAVLALGACVALLWRRRIPLTVFVLSLTPILVVAPSVSGNIAGAASLIAIYSIAVYRSSRVAMWALAGATAAVIVVAGLWMMFSADLADAIGLVVGTALFLLIGALIGVNVGNRKRYLAALIERSRQLLIERDQQAKLAAAAERTRIAREMHDIVSHALTVIIALADGASATPDPERARDATRTAAATAREALDEMRDMLGVLRDDSFPAPLSPHLSQEGVDAVIASARAAGFPASITRSGPPIEDAHVRFAVHRIVQEGVTNALRYSDHPTFVRAEVRNDPDEVVVTVENDGSHADAPTHGAGQGLRGLQERVAFLEGAIESGLIGDSRWRVRARIPKGAVPKVPPA